jgi:hypothetical protein
MKRVEFTLPDNANIFLIGDRHKGSSFSSDSDWLKTVDMIKAPYDGVKTNFVVDHGDCIEGIAIDDPRYDPLEHKDSVLKQMEDCSKEYSVIADNMILMLDGNHPTTKALKRFGEVTRKICNDAGIRFGTWSSHISYMDKKGNLMFKHFCTHGRKSITSSLSDPHRRRSALEHSLRNTLRAKWGDCKLMSRGHTHKIITSAPERDLYLYMNGEIRQGYKMDSSYNDMYIPPSLRYYASTGSFFKLYGEDGSVSYAEEADYDPIELGFVVAKVRDKQLVGLDEVIL